MRTNISSTERDDSYHVEGSIEGPISPINYSGTQVNVWGIPAGRWTDDLMNVADSNKQSQFGYMTEQMLQVKLASINTLCFVHCFLLSIFLSRDYNKSKTNHYRHHRFISLK